MAWAKMKSATLIGALLVAFGAAVYVWEVPRVFRFEFMSWRAEPSRDRDGNGGFREAAAAIALEVGPRALAAGRCGSAPGWPAASGAANAKRPRPARRRAANGCDFPPRPSARE